MLLWVRFKTKLVVVVHFIRFQVQRLPGGPGLLVGLLAGLLVLPVVVSLLFS